MSPLLFLIYVNDMPLQVRHSSVQFADDTCLICSVQSPTAVAKLLNADICSLSIWVYNSKMQFLNVKKSGVMWFSTKSCKAVAKPQVMIDHIPILQVDIQKYLGFTFDSTFTWCSHVATICKNMACYLYVINYHSKSLPRQILKMLVESLCFFKVYLCPASLGASDIT